MKRTAITVGLILSLASCSPLLSLALYNNTSTAIVICNPHLRTNACQSIPAHTLAAVLLVSDEPTEDFGYRVSFDDVVKTYRLPGYSFWSLQSPHRCKRVAYYCVVVQLEPNGSLYWIDSADGTPRASFPSQPEGFPIVPGA